jgi:hypothetical protein
MHQLSLSVIKQGPQKIITQNSLPKNSISQENKDALRKFTQQLVLKSYSVSTIRTYSNEFYAVFTIDKR